jgi:hypothetical protein
MRRACFAFVLLLAPALAPAADILSARYDAATDTLVVDIAYRGTRPDHDFIAEWDPCSPGGEVVARLIDRDGGDAARRDFLVQERFALPLPECRPSAVTLRLGRVSHALLAIPPADAAVPNPWLDVRASDLFDRRATNAFGKELGRIVDMVVDLRREEVRHVLLSFGPEEEIYAFPITAFAPVIGDERLLLAADRGTLVARRGTVPQLREGEVLVSRLLLQGAVEDLALTFSTEHVRAALLANGAVVGLAALILQTGP